MIKSSLDSYRKSCAECLVIGLCLYIAITFHNNLTEAKIVNELRATASKYRESADSEENSDFLLLRQKDPFGELFSEIYFQSSSEFTFL